jgi:hypothetical protein
MKSILVFFLCGYCSTCLSAGVANYIHLPIKSSGITFDEKLSTLRIADRADDAVFCKSKDSFHCIVARDFEFAVPKRKELPKKWMHNNQHYKVIQQLGFRSEIPAWVIERVSGNKTFWYLWSSNRGLTMFGVKESAENPSPGFFVVNGTCGFAADDSCVEQDW